MNQFPIEWHICKLKQLTTKIGSGVTPSGGRESYLDTGVPLIRSQNVLEGVLNLTNVAFISQGQHDVMSKTKLQAHDVLLNITGASIGRSCVFPEGIGEANVNQHVCIIRTKPQLYPYFLCSVLNSDIGQKQIVSFQAGGNRQGLNFEQIGAFDIPVPPLPEQRKIAQILGTWDAAIAQMEQLIAALQRRKQGLMQRLLTGEVRFPEFVGQEWNYLPVVEFVTRNSAKFDPQKQNDELPCIELEHISQETGQILDTISVQGQQSIKNRFSKGQVLFGKLRPYLRKYVQPQFDGVCSSEIWVLAGKKDICTNDYLYYLVQTHDFIAAANATTGTKMPRADWAHLSQKCFTLPWEDEQARIVRVLRLCDNEITLHQQKLTALRRQKQGLMQRLLTGAVRVPVDG